MGIGVSLILVAAGAILVWGVNGNIGSVNEDAIGWILMIVGIVGLILSMIFWSSCTSKTRPRRPGTSGSGNDVSSGAASAAPPFQARATGSSKLSTRLREALNPA